MPTLMSFASLPVAATASETLSPALVSSFDSLLAAAVVSALLLPPQAANERAHIDATDTANTFLNNLIVFSSLIFGSFNL